MRTRFRVAPAKKTLLTPDEKASMIATMRARPARSARAWAWEFRRLSATVEKFAHEAGIKLMP